MEKFFEMFSEDFWGFFVTLIPMHIIVVSTLFFLPPILATAWLLHTRKIKKSKNNPCMHFYVENGKSYCKKDLLKGKYRRCPKGKCISYQIPIEIKGKQRGISFFHIIVIWIICIILLCFVLYSDYNKAEEKTDENVDTIQLWEGVN